MDTLTEGLNPLNGYAGLDYVMFRIYPHNDLFQASVHGPRMLIAGSGID